MTAGRTSCLVSGHVYPQVDQHNWGTTFAERPLLFHNVNHGKKFDVVPPVEGTGLADVIPGARRGVWRPVQRRQNRCRDQLHRSHAGAAAQCQCRYNHWVGIKLIGGPKSPRDAIGATVFLTAGGMRQRGDVMSGGSYESSNDQRLHFGLGSAARSTKSRFAGQAELWSRSACRAWTAILLIEEGKGIMPSVYDAIAKDDITRANVDLTRIDRPTRSAATNLDHRRFSPRVSVPLSSSTGAR